MTFLQSLGIIQVKYWKIDYLNDMLSSLGKCYFKVIMLFIE